MKYVIKSKSVHSIIFPVVLSVTFLTSCMSKKETEEKPIEEITKPDKTEVSVSREQYETIKIQLGSIEHKNLSSILKSTGFLKVPPQNKASLTSAIGGTVQSILIQEGDNVKKGQALVTLVNSEFVKLQEEFLAVQSQLAYSEAEYKRQKELSEKNVSSQKTFQQIASDYNSLKIKSGSLKQRLSLVSLNADELTQENISSVIRVYSPINGSVSNIDINIGSNVQPSVAMMNVVDNSQLHLDLFIYEQDLAKVKNNQTVSFILTNLPGRSFTARIFAIGNSFERETKSIAVHAAITGETSGLIEGMNVTASIDIGNDLVPCVPASALESSAGRDYIFMQSERKEENKKEAEPGFTFEKVQIRKGITDNGYTEITPLKEVPRDAKVVTNGAFYLMAILTNAGEED